MIKRKPSQTKMTALILLLNPKDSAIENDIQSGSIASSANIVQKETQMIVPKSNRRFALNWLIILQMKNKAINGTNH